MLKIAAAIFIFLLGFGFGHGMRISSDGIRLSKNFYAVDPGNFYRSAQLTPQELSDVIRQYGIKTVINLRGVREGYPWYDDEVRVLREKNVNLVSISMATGSIPKRDELLSLLNAYAKAPRPILIHCQSGSDRTGEASAIYAMEYMHWPKEKAERMLSPRYWHFSFLVPAKTYFVEAYQGQEWARTIYDHCDKQYLFSDRRDCWMYQFISGFVSSPETDPFVAYELEHDPNVKYHEALF